MISWMQKHNKYLIVTIWIATIAFIGAGFVGWGSYQYGSKASAVGKVGDIEITQEKLDITYQNLYSQYNEAFQGKFDDAKAKEMGLPQQAFNSLKSQAQLLNLAKEYGVVVSDGELSDYVTSIAGFHDDGKFSKVIYNTYLRNRRMKAKTFEAILKDELIVKKIMELLSNDSSAFEVEVLASALSISDKIAYKVISTKDIAVTLSDKELKEYWEPQKSNYMTTKAYELAIFWTSSNDTNISEDELKDFYEKNSFNYTDADGKQFTFEKARGVVEQDFKIKKTKKMALLDFVAFKKNEKKETEIKTIPENSPVLSKAIWAEIANAKIGDTLKPKVVGLRYATVKILKIVDPKEKSFEQARAQLMAEMTATKKSELLDKQSKDALESIDTDILTTTDWLTMSKFDNMKPLNRQETLQFLQKLFTSSAKKGMITVSDAVVIYKVVDQKMEIVDNNLSKNLESDADRIKKSVFEKNLFKALNDKYSVEKYVKGI